MNDNKKHIIQFIFFLVAIIFLIKLFSLQVIESKYKLAAKDNTVRRIPIYPYRGIIYDRNEKIIVQNIPVFDLMIVKNKAHIEDTTLFCHLLNISVSEFDSIMNSITGLAVNKPMPFMKQISNEEYHSMEDRFYFRGFHFAPRVVRSYPYATLANSLGYIAEISKTALNEDTTQYYKQGDFVGKSGIEASYEKELRGKRGAKFVMVNVKGIEQGPYHEGKFDSLPEPGTNLISTIDIELQQYGELLMQNKVGSIVAIEPKTGEILSIISSPSYDPNLLTGRLYSQNYSVLLRDSLKPLFDRATNAGYPPGSIFKLLQAAIFLEEGLVTKNQSIYVDRYPNMGDHSPAGYYTIHDAIRRSSNWYFAKMYKRLLQRGVLRDAEEDAEIGFDNWRNYVLKFGLGHKLGSDISHEKGGFVPSNSYYDRYYGDKGWKASTIISNAIGQGELLVIPLQMANFSAIIANKGYYIRPHLIKGIGSTDTLRPEFKQKISVGIEERHFEVIIDAMEAVIANGTARRAFLKDIVVCGKTGTAENPHGEDHSVFVAFAPKDDPKIAISVYVENAGFGGTWAAPIASLMIEKYLTGEISNPAKEKRIIEQAFIPVK